MGKNKEKKMKKRSGDNNVAFANTIPTCKAIWVKKNTPFYFSSQLLYGEAFRKSVKI